jgi:hypothetical protein
MERRAASSAASGRSVSDVDEDLSALENQRHHKEYDRDQLLKKQVRRGGSRTGLSRGSFGVHRETLLKEEVGMEGCLYVSV